MRKFGLITGTGKVIDLTSRMIFLHEPDGLGFEIETEYRAMGQHWSLLNKVPQQNPITGTIAFIGENPYQQYYEFIQDITKDGLIFTYTTDDGLNVFKKRVIATSIGKTEIVQAGYLDCNVSFTPSTPWYKDLRLITSPVENISAPGFVFDTGLTWGYKFRSTIDMTININVDSHKESPCALIIDGPITNPVWRHFVNNQLVATGRVNCTVLSGDHLSIDNRGDSYEIKVYNEDNTTVVQDAYQLSDFTTDRFIKLQNGQNLIHVSGDTATLVPIRLEANIYYESV